MLSSLFAFLVSIVLLTGVNPNFLTCFSIEVQPLSAQDFIEPTGFHNIPGVKFSSFQLLSNNGNNIHNGFQSPLNGLNMSPPLLSHTQSYSFADFCILAVQFRDEKQSLAWGKGSRHTTQKGKRSNEDWE